MFHFESKHWTLLALFLGATGMLITGLDHWSDLLNPKVFGGFLTQLAVVLKALNTGAPAKQD